MPRRLALSSLLAVERGGRAREALESLGGERRLDSRDRTLAHELVHGSLRRQITLDHLLAPHLKRPLAKADASVRAALRLGAHQIVFLDRIPPHAAVHTSVELVKEAGQARAAGFVNAVLRRLAGSLAERGSAGPDDLRRAVPTSGGLFALFNGPVLPDPASEPVAHLEAAFSMPAWLIERVEAQHGREGLIEFLAAGITRPSLSLRPSAGRETELTAALDAAETPWESEGRCLLLSRAGAVTELPGFADGAFAVQDPTAAEVVPLLDPQPGEGILELCAAPGGKTIDIAERVGETGKLLAVDLPGSRSDLLRAEVVRRGLGNVAVLGADATDETTLPRGLADRAVPGFDAVLLDAPCSNTGVLSRRVEARHRLEGPDRIAMLGEQAEHLLLIAASRVRPGGRLVYSTCSIDRTENQDVVARFLDEDPDFTLISEQTTLPIAGRRSGGYAALLTHSG